MAKRALGNISHLHANVLNTYVVPKRSKLNADHHHHHHHHHDHEKSILSQKKSLASTTVSLAKKCQTNEKDVPDKSTKGKENVPVAANLKDSAAATTTINEVQKVPVELGIDFSDPVSYYKPPPKLPKHVDDYDKSQLLEVDSEPHYAYEVFEYYFRREKQFRLSQYMGEQVEISKNMRAILVDWIVEVQETFQMNHETIYLSVKIVDTYLSKALIKRSRFQLLGAAAVFIAAKFDERNAPHVDDYLYICDDAYSRHDFILMEREILQTIDFELGMPISYRFLRRYARCAGLSMEMLTLARYILEMSLMDYDMVFELESTLAAAALLLSLKMKKGGNVVADVWTPTLEFYTKYKESDLVAVMYKLNDILITPSKQNLKTIKSKYLTRTFFEVAKTEPLRLSTHKH